MTDTPGIYGEIGEPAKVAYARWLMALFDRTGHVYDGCPFGCQDNDFVCSEGREKRDAEQQRLLEWRAVRDAEVTT